MSYGKTFPPQYVVVDRADFRILGQAPSPGSVLDHSVDLYALGVVVFEMLTGRKPFNSKIEYLEWLAARVPDVSGVRPELIRFART